MHMLPYCSFSTTLPSLPSWPHVSPDPTLLLLLSCSPHTPTVPSAPTFPSRSSCCHAPLTCVCVCVCVCLFVCVCVCVRTYVMCMSVCVSRARYDMSMCTCSPLAHPAVMLPSHVCVCVCVCVWLCVSVCAYVCVRTYVHMYVCYVHGCMCRACAV